MGSAHRGRQTEVSKPHAVEVSRPHPVEVKRARLVELNRSRHAELSSSYRAQLVMQSSARHAELNSSCRAQLVSPGQLVRVDYVRPPTSEGHISFVRTPIWVFLDFIESPLSQEYIDTPEEDRKCHAKVLDGARHFSAARLFRSARQG